MTPALPPLDTCLFLDVDGTLIDIAATPDGVHVPPTLYRDLAAARSRFGGAVALVSGRTISDLDRIFAPLCLRASGVHGAEFRFDDGEDSAVLRRVEPIAPALLDDLLVVLGAFPACLVENKGFSYAVHYRAAPEIGPQLHAALEIFLAAHPGAGLVLLPGHYVFELKRPAVDKGSAIADFMTRVPFAGKRPVFIGDDVTDMPGFVAVRERGGWAYGVGRAFPAVDATFSDPEAVRAWLSAVVRQEVASS